MTTLGSNQRLWLVQLGHSDTFLAPPMWSKRRFSGTPNVVTVTFFGRLIAQAVQLQRLIWSLEIAEMNFWQHYSCSGMQDLRYKMIGDWVPLMTAWTCDVITTHHWRWLPSPPGKTTSLKHFPKDSIEVTEELTGDWRVIEHSQSPERNWELITQLTKSPQAY